MKTIVKRTLALLLAAVMTVGVCACNGSGGSGGSGNGKIKPLDKEEEAILKELGDNGLDGYEFTVVDFSDGRWNKDKSGTPYQDAWVQLMDEVEALYNCKITALPPLEPGAMFEKIQPEIMASGKYADLIVATQWQMGYFLGADLLMDLNTLNVNWDNKWWNQDVRQILTFGGSTKVGCGSFIFDTAQTWLLYYNEALWQKNNFEDPYKLVDEGRWTQDLFAKYCKQAMQDRDGSGKVDSTDDTWGVIAANGDFCRAWYMALGGQYFTTDEQGHVVLGCNTDRTYSIVEKMQNMVKKDQSVSRLTYADEAAKIADFINGGALFYAYMPGVGGLQDMEDDWGVMPLPKYDESQPDYYSGVDHNACLFAVANTNKDTDQVSIVLEALGRHAMILEDIYWPDYKETYWRHREDDPRIVSDYVVGHGRHDLALIMQNCNRAIFAAPLDRVYNTVFVNATDFASWVDMVQDTITYKLDEYFQY